VSLRVIPLRLRFANKLVDDWHRHHQPARGHRFSIGAIDETGTLHGAAIVGRPVSQGFDPDKVAEVVRLVTNGKKNAPSLLYAAAARACREMGFEKIQTYILESETGTTLLAAGWTLEARTKGGDWNRPSRGGRRTDQPMEDKQRWSKILNPAIPIDRSA
jgi:hypothetical protein